MAKWLCEVCGFIYDESKGDEDSGINSEIKFEDISDDWVCPLCGILKTDLSIWKKIEG